MVIHFFSDMTTPCLLFVAGGCADYECSITSVELIDLCLDDDVTTCIQPQDLSRGGDDGISLRTPTGTPLFCKGYHDIGCYEYDPSSNTWNERSPTLGSRYEGAATVELPDNRFWILGGTQGDEYTTEYYVNGQFVEGPALPEEIGDSYFPCAASIDADLTFYSNEVNKFSKMSSVVL